MNAQKPWWSAVVAIAALGIACGNQSSGAGGNAAGGSGVTSAASGPSTSSSKAATSSSSKSTSAGTGGAATCDPPAPANSLYAQTAVTTALDTISMCQYRGEVLLIVDTAGA